MLNTLLRSLPMVRLRAAVSLVALGAAASCTGTIQGGGGVDAAEETPAQRAAREAWENPNGAFDSLQYCASCHAATASSGGYDYLAGVTRTAGRQSILEFNAPGAVTNMNAPASSRLLSKGEHNGARALMSNEASAILTWLEAEAVVAGGGGGVTLVVTEPINVTITTDPLNPITNTIPLASLGLADATITFLAQPISSYLYLTQLKVNGGSTGAHLVHPLFASVPADPEADVIPDSIDRFFNADPNVEPNMSASLSGGAAGFADFPPTNKLQISFELVEEYQPDDEPPPTGQCKALTSFVSVAKPQLQNNCTSCHGGGNGSATGALDMSMLGTNDAAACAQILNQIDTVNINQSQIFLSPTPGSGHPFTFGGNMTNFNNYRTAVTPWIEAERDAP
ncbi:MAG: NUDIX hydrolase [Kofleriaceae bacterium]